MERIELKEESRWISTQNEEILFEQLNFNEEVGYIEPLKPAITIKNRGMMAFDTETRDGLKGKELFCWSIAYYGKTDYNFDREIKEIDGYVTKTNDDSNGRVSSGYNFEKLFDIIKCSDRKHKRVIWVHNLSFDCRFIEQYCVDNKIPFSTIRSGSNMLQIEIIPINALFRDSVQFLKASQQQAEIDWKIPEFLQKDQTNAHEIFEQNFLDWSDDDKERVLLHNKNDTKALLHIMHKFRQTIFDIAGVDMLACVSMAQLAMKAFRVSLNLNNPENLKIMNPIINLKNNGKKKSFIFDDELDSFIRDSYFGGRTEVFDSRFHNNAKYVDTVSRYPADMDRNYFPNGRAIKIDDSIECNQKLEQLYQEIEPKYSTNLQIDYLSRILFDEEPEIEFNENRFGVNRTTEKFIHEGFMYCHINPPDKPLKYPLLPLRLDNKVVFANIPMKATFALPELRWAVELGYKIKPISGVIFTQNDRIFKQHIPTLFNMKSRSSGGKKIGAKYLMNTLTGKFGQKRERDDKNEQFFTDKKEFIEYMEKIQNQIDFNPDIWNFIWSDESDFGIISESVTKISTHIYFDIAIIAYIISYSRVQLHKMMIKAQNNGYLVLYSDTDSITFMFNENEINKIEFDMVMDGMPKEETIGLWDIEQTFDIVKFIAPKAYISVNLDLPFIKLKGIDRFKISEIRKEVREKTITQFGKKEPKFNKLLEINIDEKIKIRNPRVNEIISQIEPDLWKNFQKILIREIERTIREPISLAEKYMTSREAHNRCSILNTKQITKFNHYENKKRNFNKDGTSVAWTSDTLPKEFYDDYNEIMKSKPKPLRKEQKEEVEK